MKVARLKAYQLIFLSVVVVAVFMAGAVFIYQTIKSDKSNTENQTTDVDPAKQFIDNYKNEDEAKLSDFVIDYESEYQASLGAIADFDVDNPVWPKYKIDAIHFALLYADKVGDFTKVQNLVAMIDIQKKFGADVNDNKYQLGQAERDEIANRARDKSLESNR